MAAFLAAHGLGDARARAPGRRRLHPAVRTAAPSGRRQPDLHGPAAAAGDPPCPPDASEAERAAPGLQRRSPASPPAASRPSCASPAICAGARLLGARGRRRRCADAGLAVLEDLGDDLYARLIEGGDGRGRRSTTAAIDALVRLHAEAPPPVLDGAPGSWPLLAYDDLALKTGGLMFLEWLAEVRRAWRPSRPRRSAEWEALWAPIRARGVAGASVFCHRDYHAENLIWLPSARGAARVGHARLPGRPARPPGVGPLHAAARRPPRRLARARGGGAGALSRRPARGRPRGGSLPTSMPWARSTSRASWASSPAWWRGDGKPRYARLHAEALALSGPLPGRSGRWPALKAWFDRNVEAPRADRP